MREIEEDPHHQRRQQTVPALDLQDLKVLSFVGRGAKGVVFLAKNEWVSEYVALKAISKALLDKKEKDLNMVGNEYKRVCFEQQVLRRLDHPLLPRLRGILDTDHVIGYAIDYCSGGNLNALRKKQTEKMFSDDIIRFYSAEIVLALEYLHRSGIVYRDLKPENIMIQGNGHIMLIDFDLSTKLKPKPPQSSSNTSSPNRPPVSDKAKKKKKNKKKKNKDNKNRKPRFPPLAGCFHTVYARDDSDAPIAKPEEPASSPGEKSNSFVGTEEYVAPEVVSGRGHDFRVDWWSLGVVMYEMLYGRTPFRGSNRKDTFYRILASEPELTGETTPLRDLIRKLLVKDPNRRIDVEGIKGHNFFKGIEWDSVLQIARPPFIPQNEMVEEDTEGINRIDVELFVDGLFFGNEKKEEEKEKEEVNNNNNLEDVGNKRIWVKELNQDPKQSERFNIF